ncbi:hypothetical protein [Actinomyces sp. MRS3W]|uniref:hypothetical protein n=1 Tax=Actinomyces sp. MRS3W TaxID=2800796 RepID=UPI0028FD5AB0|nr:hypothetical protein [Actinomyces sp. MRS3W]MDU0348813.1 hypothetical protein [Actinomyces sp. MRS3W]
MGRSPRSVRISGSAGSADRLTAARAALIRAEEHAGLRGRAAHEVARTLDAQASAPRGMLISGAAALAAAPPAQVSESAPAPTPLLSVITQVAGVVTLTGSVSALLALAAVRQGREDWCGVVGCEGLGWSAAAEAGLDLSRVLAVSSEGLAASPLATATAALLDGVGVLLVSTTAASRLHPGDRRALLARARERGRLVLTPFPWESARPLNAVPAVVGTALPSTLASAGAPPTPVETAGGVVVPLRGRIREEPAPQEMPGGHVRHLAWDLHTPYRPGRVRLVLDAAGARLIPGPAPEAPESHARAPRSQLVLVGAADDGQRGTQP